MLRKHYQLRGFDNGNENEHELDDGNFDRGPPLSLVMFLDNGLPLEVPCPRNMSDRAFLQHISLFYYLQKMRKGMLEVLGFKTLGAVEVVEMQGSHNRVVGRRDMVLGLGRYDGNRMIYLLRHPKAAGFGSSIVQLLREKGVLTETGQLQNRRYNSHATSVVNSQVNSRANSPVNEGNDNNDNNNNDGNGRSSATPPPQPSNIPVGNILDIPNHQWHSARNDSLQYWLEMYADLADDKVRALNFVSTWHTNFAALAVATPVVLSVAVSVAWPAIAVLTYGADIQTSVQTGVAIGSYVVTAGAVLIALVTFAASVYDSNAKYTEDLQSQITLV